MRFFLLAVLCLILPAAVLGQTMVEHSLATGAASAASSGMSGAGKSVAGAMQRAAQALDAAGKTSTGPSKSSTIIITSSSQAPEPPGPKKTYEDPVGIKTGLAWDELVRRFGEPVMKTTDPDGVVRCWYESPKAQYTLTLKDSKVATVSSDPKKETAGIVVIQ